MDNSLSNITDYSYEPVADHILELSPHSDCESIK